MVHMKCSVTKKNYSQAKQNKPKTNSQKRRPKGWFPEVGVRKWVKKGREIESIIL